MKLYFVLLQQNKKSSYKLTCQTLKSFLLHDIGLISMVRSEQKKCIIDINGIFYLKLILNFIKIVNRNKKMPWWVIVFINLQISNKSIILFKTSCPKIIEFVNLSLLIYSLSRKQTQKYILKQVSNDQVTVKSAPFLS